ncbi:winged helix DNA-binding domain-containing protein [Microbacterium sp. zg.Y1090]|uniref:winged helix-turn-helix domain-containing protein n=1 Tax=Microbacterium TaxID=33882 RepID=UPI00214C6694|nr:MULTISPECIES: crosslink repair DNA glycosylase YcaQ family protein [unclassified Microbacterium]MCR2812169.1 winged helix DNA-binding domain-containing protein [Microbacterium sp. zg.Y1084]MCR2818393.1 winged helix DNA-binding domain-containing protein [Microbacterium sp. zg.Y1090]MDL5486206.1 crosslink repair DNA glycosylase YcaQ family protein [Microbacterium sp. zg-Y1211]WIM29407.1 crosslink repair DNA glycosylase YcaQ family protein [Microbacterium sp. zg-Y1090]
MTTATGLQRPRDLSRAEARRIALAAQGFARPRPGTVGTRQLNLALARMATLQIDSVNVFARSHYLPLFSRLGPYDPALLDRLLFSRGGRYTESWAHMASFIPTSDWGLFAFRHEAMRERYLRRDAEWFRAHGDVVDEVRAQLAARGPLRAAQIDHASRVGGRGPWWDWDVVKSALEYLFLFGEVAIAGRRGFERRYGLAADVIPEAARTPVARDEAIRELVGRAAAAYGVATASDLADYWRIRDRAAVMQAVGELADAGILRPVTVEGWQAAGRPAKAWLHRDAALPRRIDAAAVLTPFDPLVWFRDRAERLFDFTYRIEIYTPAAERRHGYYSLPVLIGDDVVGRVDLKADRARSTLLVQSAWWEPGRPARAAERLADELRAAARWQGLESISVGRWGDAADEVAGALGDAERHDRQTEPAAATPASAGSPDGAATDAAATVTG